MTEEVNPAAIEELATDAHSIADGIRTLNQNQGRQRSLGWAAFVSSLLTLVVIVVMAIIVQPILNTAKTVEDVAGTDARAHQAQQSVLFFTAFLCTQRANTSEARVLDGREPLPLKKGCPPYDFRPEAPIIPPGLLTPPTTEGPDG